MCKNILCIDTETTGIDIAEDYVIQLAYIIIDSHFKELVKKSFYILPDDPNFKIRAEAFEKHGITKEYLVNKGYKFADIADEVKADFDKADTILSYNGIKFDTAFIEKLFGGVSYDFTRFTYIDSYLIECANHPHTLEAVYERFTGAKPDNAHDAFDDVKSTITVFRNQLLAKEKLEGSCFHGYDIYPGGKFERRADGDWYITFGKHQGESIQSLMSSDPEYIKWLGDKVVLNRQQFVNRVLRPTAEKYYKSELKETDNK